MTTTPTTAADAADAVASAAIEAMLRNPTPAPPPQQPQSMYMAAPPQAQQPMAQQPQYMAAPPQQQQQPQYMAAPPQQQQQPQYMAAQTANTNMPRQPHVATSPPLSPHGETAARAAASGKPQPTHIRDLLVAATERGATDIIICVGLPPRGRINGELANLGDYAILTPEVSRALCYQVMTETQQKKFEENWELDFSFGMRDMSRFRANVFMQRGSVSGAFRRIPMKVKTIEELNLPTIVREMCEKPNGLVLVTGPTGSGKSTTLAAMINHINATQHAHIITIEDPIEYLHKHNSCTIEQREIGSDTKSFHSALKSILRQDPDIVLLGEMRDPESIQAALTISETGHLCFATLHTNSCSQTLSRIVDVFPEGKQQQVRTQLALTLNAVFTQTLVPRADGGLQLIMEIMVATSAIKALIRDNKIHNIDNSIQTGSKFGMISMNQALANAVLEGKIKEEDAFAASGDHEDLRMCLLR